MMSELEECGNEIQREKECGSQGMCLTFSVVVDRIPEITLGQRMVCRMTKTSIFRRFNAQFKVQESCQLLTMIAVCLDR